MVFYPGQEVHEKMHKKFHDNFSFGVDFTGWKNEKVIKKFTPLLGSGGKSGKTSSDARIVAVDCAHPKRGSDKVEEILKMVERDLGGGSDSTRLDDSETLFLYISQKRVRGAVIAHRIDSARTISSFHRATPSPALCSALKVIENSKQELKAKLFSRVSEPDETQPNPAVPASSSPSPSPSPSTPSSSALSPSAAQVAPRRSPRKHGCLIQLNNNPGTLANGTNSMEPTSETEGAPNHQGGEVSSPTRSYSAPGRLLSSLSPIKKPHQDNSSPSVNNAFLLRKRSESTPVQKKAVIGIDKIWVHNKYRRQGIASEMLDAIRASFIYGYVVPKHELAFSQPTESGTCLATVYTRMENFLSYK